MPVYSVNATNLTAMLSALGRVGIVVDGANQRDGVQSLVDQLAKGGQVDVAFPNIPVRYWQGNRQVPADDPEAASAASAFRTHKATARQLLQVHAIVTSSESEQLFSRQELEGLAVLKDDMDSGNSRYQITGAKRFTTSHQPYAAVMDVPNTTVGLALTYLMGGNVGSQHMTDGLGRELQNIKAY